MPSAYAAEVKRWLQDHDTDYLNQAPPVQNTWYEVFHAYDVRLLWCVVWQNNTEEGNKDIEVRWTIDGNVYLASIDAVYGTPYYVWRDYNPSTVGTLGLSSGQNAFNGTYYVDKRGLDFKVEVRLTSVVGTNQVLRCWCVRETLEQT